MLPILISVLLANSPPAKTETDLSGIVSSIQQKARDKCAYLKGVLSNMYFLTPRADYEKAFGVAAADVLAKRDREDKRKLIASSLQLCQSDHAWRWLAAAKANLAVARGEVDRLRRGRRFRVWLFVGGVVLGMVTAAVGIGLAAYGWGEVVSR